MIAVLFDIHAWRERTDGQLSGLDLNGYVQHICVFLRALLLEHDDLELSVFLVGPFGATLLGSSPGQTHDADVRIVSEVVSGVQRCLDDASSSPGSKSPAWATAFLQALCHVKKSITRLEADDSNLTRPTAQHNRILSIVSSSGDTSASTAPSSSKYLAFMNGFFAAQRDKIVLDCCALDTQKSTEELFRQGCTLTSGFFLKPTLPEALLQYLMTSFVADAPTREYLRYPAEGGVDFRASCFCHQKLVDMGYVCSVCLSVFCTKKDTCTTCGSKFQ